MAKMNKIYIVSFCFLLCVDIPGYGQTQKSPPEEEMPKVDVTIASKKTKPKPHYQAASETITVKFSSDADATLYIDGHTKADLTKDEPKPIRLGKGDYLIKAVSVLNAEDESQFKYSVTTASDGKLVDISLKDIINQRKKRKTEEDAVAKAQNEEDPVYIQQKLNEADKFYDENNKADAAEIFLKYCQHSLFSSQEENNLGEMYYFGDGRLTQNFYNAEKWYRKAAERGNSYSSVV